MSQKSNSYARTVYTTESGRICPQCGQPESNCRCKKKATARPLSDGIVRLQLEKKGRGGKTVTVITGLPGSEEDLRTLAGELKRRCGTGGTLKDGIIEIQGDHRDSLIETLKARGFTVKRVGG
jgi:translation initiation factor 1